MKTIRVKALRAFAGRIDGNLFTVDIGDELEMPGDADWVKAGLAELVEPPRKRTRRRATKKAAEER